MGISSALPFKLRRSSDVISGGGITTTTETVHGLLRLDKEELVIQWRLARKTDHLGGEIRSDEELEAVREARIPLRSLSGAVVKNPWWPWPSALRFEITASDLVAFQEVAGQAGLRMAHPAQLALGVARRDRLAAQEFAADLTLMVAERALAAFSDRRSLPEVGYASEQSSAVQKSVTEGGPHEE